MPFGRASNVGLRCCCCCSLTSNEVWDVGEYTKWTWTKTDCRNWELGSHITGWEDGTERVIDSKPSYLQIKLSQYIHLDLSAGAIFSWVLSWICNLWSSQIEINAPRFYAHYKSNQGGLRPKQPVDWRNLTLSTWASSAFSATLISMASKCNIVKIVSVLYFIYFWAPELSIELQHRMSFPMTTLEKSSWKWQQHLWFMTTWLS